MWIRFVSRSCAVGLWLACFASPAASALPVRTVALVGDPAPGAARLAFSLVSGATAHRAFVINPNGQAAFVGRLTNPSDSPHFGRLGIWAETGAGLELVALEGEPAAGAGGLLYSDLINRTSDSITFNERGEVGFNSFLFSEEGFTTGSASWVGRPGEVELIARQGDPNPSGDPERFIGLLVDWPPAIVDPQVAAIFSHWLDLPNQTRRGISAVSSFAGGELAAVIQPGFQAVGFPAGVEVTSSTPPTRIGRAGPVFIDANLRGVAPGSDGSDTTTATYLIEDGELELLFDHREVTPPTAPGVSVDFFPPPAFNERGDLAVLTQVRGDGIDDSNDEIVWTGRLGELTQLVRSGDQVPGAEPGVVIGGSQRGPNITNAEMDALGNVFFAAHLAGEGVDETNDRSLLSTAGGSLRMIARTGDQAPGLPADAELLWFGAYASNARGQLAFQAQWSSPSGDGSGIWVADPQGVLEPIVLTGETIEVAPGDFRTIAGLRQFHRDLFNDRGDVGFGASFTDGTSGSFVSGRVAIPEPSSGVTAFLAVAALLANVRRRPAG